MLTRFALRVLGPVRSNRVTKSSLSSLRMFGDIARDEKHLSQCEQMFLNSVLNDNLEKSNRKRLILCMLKKKNDEIENLSRLVEKLTSSSTHRHRAPTEQVQHHLNSLHKHSLKSAGQMTARGVLTNLLRAIHAQEGIPGNFSPSNVTAYLACDKSKIHGPLALELLSIFKNANYGPERLYSDLYLTLLDSTHEFEWSGDHVKLHHTLSDDQKALLELILKSLGLEFEYTSKE